MMPRTLNVEKLEKKFSSLTRSRESIQGLSSWIMHHKEFSKEIVQEWLSGLTKDFNTLTMFYVANDVILNCARKKAPEFREAFSTVLKKAVCLEKVREIKSDVNRLLTIWNERDIYDDKFFRNLENTLNGVENEQGSEPEELSESEIISNFKVKNLINCLQNLRNLEDLLQEKEVILKDLEEPVMPNLENLIVKMESQSEIKKLDEYYDYVEEYISLSSSVEEARKALLKELKYSSVYYSIQNEDVKKVAHAYRIYGKKLKNMEKMVLEKMCSLEGTLQSPVQNDSPDNHDADLHVPQKSPCGDVSLHEPENVSIGDKMNESHEFTKEGNQNTNKKTNGLEKISPINSHEEVNNCNEGKNGCVTIQSSKNLTDADTLKTENSVINVDESVAESSVSMKGTTTDSVDGYSNEVDFLLEEAYDNRHIKSKSNFKRKLETLLNAKGKKPCHISPQNDKGIEPIPNNDLLGSHPMNNLDFASLTTKISESEVSSETGHKLIAAIEKSSEALNTSSDEHLEHKPNSETDNMNKSANLDSVDKDRKEDHSVQSEGKKQQKFSLLQTLSEVISSGKTVSETYNQLSEIPSELLKNILNKNKMNMTHSAQNMLDNECPNKLSKTLAISTEISDANSPKIVNITNETRNVLNSTDDGKSNITEIKSCSPNDYLSKDLKIPCLGDKILPSDSCKDKNFTSGSSASVYFKENQIKEGILASEKVKSDASEKENSHNEERPSLTETLQNVLKFISENEVFKNQAVKDQISHNPPTLMPLENTLKLYQYMMQHYGQTSDEQKLLSTEMKSNESAKIDALSIQNNSVSEHSSTQTPSESRCVNMPVCSNKKDNLEIMDMDVDSGEENMDS